MFNPHKQAIRGRERYERDGPYVTKLNDSTKIQVARLAGGNAETTVAKDLGGGCELLIFRDVLGSEERVQYLQSTSTVERVPDALKTHLHMNYTRDGGVPSYADVNQKTLALPSPWLTLAEKVADDIQTAKPGFGHTVLDTALELEMGPDLRCGGTFVKQSDKCGFSSHWGAVALVSFGQTRWLKVTKNGAQGTINIALPDNCAVVLYGTGIHSLYQHEISPLPEGHPVGTHLLSKIRFRRPYENTNDVGAAVRVHNSRSWLKTAKQKDSSH
tara:strand:- start:8655 stop:9470 length:816 start_codon:yes stop_codon:yes gene_type:complete